MSFSYDRYERQRRRQTYGSTSNRSTFGYWVPLVVTVTAAAVGIAAWIWSERRDDESDADDDRGGDRGDRPPLTYRGGGPGETSFTMETEGQQADEGSMMARMSGALRRTPSPQQILDGASKKVAAGVAAAGAVVGGALSSIKEEDKDDYVDHSRWSEEAKTRETRPGVPSSSGLRAAEQTSIAAVGSDRQQTKSTKRSEDGRRKTVALVMSAESSRERFDDGDSGFDHEHASILSHLPEHIDPIKIRIFVLIYAPELTQHPLASTLHNRPTTSVTSSFSNIGHEEAHTPFEEADKPLSLIDPKTVSSGANSPASRSPLFDALYVGANNLVEKETMILPFTTTTGHVHILRHLAPEIVYIQESLCGENGDAVTHISGWVGQVVVVVGDDGGHGGLIDSEDDMGPSAEKGEPWWEKGDRVGLGKGIEVVESLRVGEDWGRRVGGRE
ncbi:MAG: hypothetical protein M1827_006082 [Pycnora praestabilis]|nr:MAG: hypothetical protein M1827_006082 [Pycnora praestabilis]